MGHMGKGKVAGFVGDVPLNKFLVDIVPHRGYTGAGVFSENGNLLGILILESYDMKFNLVMPCVPISYVSDRMNIVFK